MFVRADASNHVTPNYLRSRLRGPPRLRWTTGCLRTSRWLRIGTFVFLPGIATLDGYALSQSWRCSPPAEERRARSATGRRTSTEPASPRAACSSRRSGTGRSSWISGADSSSNPLQCAREGMGMNLELGDRVVWDGVMFELIAYDAESARLRAVDEGYVRVVLINELQRDPSVEWPQREIHQVRTFDPQSLKALPLHQQMKIELWLPHVTRLDRFLSTARRDVEETNRVIAEIVRSVDPLTPGGSVDPRTVWRKLQAYRTSALWVSLTSGTGRERRRGATLFSSRSSPRCAAAPTSNPQEHADGLSTTSCTPSLIDTERIHPSTSRVIERLTASSARCLEQSI